MFTEDCKSKGFADDPEYVFTRPATQIVVMGPDGEVLQTIDLPELRLTRDEVSPAWLDVRDAEEGTP
jgi:hypothetical protein